MRPRYRAWVYDPDLEEYVIKDVAKLDFYLDTFEVSMVYTLATVQRKSTELTFTPYDIKDVILMQDTGLKDKNNKKIYDGDIVKITLTETQKTRRGEVIYYDDNACYLVETTKEEYFTFMSQDIKSVEVLGNIHENKGLLNE